MSVVTHYNEIINRRARKRGREKEASCCQQWKVLRRLQWWLSSVPTKDRFREKRERELPWERSINHWLSVNSAKLSRQTHQSLCNQCLRTLVADSEIKRSSGFITEVRQSANSSGLRKKLREFKARQSATNFLVHSRTVCGQVKSILRR